MPENIKFSNTKLDKSKQIESIQALAMQCEDAWEQTKKLVFAQNYNRIRNIVVAGMGASNYNAEIIGSLYHASLPVPLQLVSDYTLPGYCDFNSLVVLSSYSGNTEEVMNVGRQALKAGALLSGISGGGEVAEFLLKQHAPNYVFDGKHNACRVPRIGFGYSIFGLLGILNNLRVLNIDDREVGRVIAFMKSQNKVFDPKLDESKNWAKQMAKTLYGKMPIIVGAEHLLGNSRVFRNQITENAKQFSARAVLPDLNHYLMEGLGHPVNVKDLMFVFLETSLFSQVMRKRVEVTKSVLDKQNIAYTSFLSETDTPLMNVFELLQKGSFVAYYLAMLNDEDPSPNVWVDYFKGEMKKDNS